MKIIIHVSVILHSCEGFLWDCAGLLLECSGTVWTLARYVTCSVVSASALNGVVGQGACSPL